MPQALGCSLPLLPPHTGQQPQWETIVLAGCLAVQVHGGWVCCSHSWPPPGPLHHSAQGVLVPGMYGPHVTQQLWRGSPLTWLCDPVFCAASACPLSRYHQLASTNEQLASQLKEAHEALYDVQAAVQATPPAKRREQQHLLARVADAEQVGSSAPVTCGWLNRVCSGSVISNPCAWHWPPPLACICPF